MSVHLTAGLPTNIKILERKTFGILGGVDPYPLKGACGRMLREDPRRASRRTRTGIFIYDAELSVRRHMRMREAVIILGVIATLLAILSDTSERFDVPMLKDLNPDLTITVILRFLLILIPIASPIVLAMANRFQEGERWLALKTGAENVMRVIYLPRTILSPAGGITEQQRDQWLEELLAEIRRETLQSVNGNLEVEVGVRGEASGAPGA